MKKQRFEVLDSFRGLCAICVVVYHLHFLGSITELSFFRGSSIFVEFFFVLSGFVLAHGYGFRPDQSFKPYFKARFFRLYPLHLFMLLVFVFLEAGKWGVLKVGGITLNNPAFTNDYALQGIIPNLFLIHAWTPFTNPLSFNTPSWSISIEFYMYILLFLTIVLFHRFRQMVWLLIPVWMFSLMAIESDLFVSPVMRGLSGFFGGAFFYVVYRRYSQKITVPYNLSTLIEVILVISVVYVVQSDLEYRSIAATSLFYIVVFCFAFESGAVSKSLKYRFFQHSGKLSYSIYMTHAAIIYLLTSIMVIIQKISGVEVAPMMEGVRYFTTGNVMINNLSVMVILIMVMIVSNMTYRYIEVKGQQYARSGR